MPRSLEKIDADLKAAALRRKVHTDPVSLQGNMRFIDNLLDERFLVRTIEKEKVS